MKSIVKVNDQFKVQIFICPADEQTNWSISKDPSQLQEEPCINTECYFGRNMKKLSVYVVDEVVFRRFQKSKMLQFYAFKQATKAGKKQYFYSQNIKKKPDSKLASELQRLFEQMQKEKVIPVF